MVFEILEVALAWLFTGPSGRWTIVFGIQEVALAWLLTGLSYCI